MPLTIRPAQLEEILHLYRQIPEFGSCHSLAELQQRIAGRPASLLIAEIGGQPAGFKLGYQDTPDTFYSWLGGVLPTFRRHGVAQALLQEQENWVRAQRYRKLSVKTRNQFRAMLMMLIANGYQIIALEKKGEVADYRLMSKKNR